jgi:cytochrome b involved in lipid metabolism
MAPQVEDGLIHVEGKMYSAEKLAKFHPGGQLFIKVTQSG